MFDAKIRPWIDPPLNSAARQLVRLGMSANGVTAVGFGFTLANFVFLAFSLYPYAIVCIVLGRIMDGLDGAVARQTRLHDPGANMMRSGESDLGGYLDIVSDFIFYAGTVFFFAVGQPQFALPAAFLLFTFVASGSTFLAYAILAGKRGINHEAQGKKSFFYLGGIMEGAETIFFLILFCLFPMYFKWSAIIFGALCLLTALGRVRQAFNDFSA
ncbi:MAG: CDP-alcohol phosphatidyltransferase family protein [Alphaproteobacteria bacterium]|nr:CDP-alcohol phosphatidyltransferase family protein [Alphaproteobacteria bacterium]